ncbi:hypothetical protein T265_10836 [Opisthorchis viverrini]|uniref:Uncharacterized protein n=1 Tax=Opisthorchis viverrini TaxID=6198 RepID=A0A074Z579_OPIVI|nr:hypothetical protein T265_10836 [Opisthorchis viverrini]KER20662.1 hypothetical protein T265_10836 [Opisthorchis viverrini]
MSTRKNELLHLISVATVESFWSAFDRVNEQHGLICDEKTGNTPLHFLVLSLPKLVRSFTVDLKQSTSQPDVITDETSCAPWISAAVALLYRLVVLGNVPVNAQNSQGNTVMHLSCIRPHAEVLQVHLIRLGKTFLTRLLEIFRQPTTGFALLEAHQVGVVPEFPSNLCSTRTQIGLFSRNTLICKSVWILRETRMNLSFMIFYKFTYNLPTMYACADPLLENRYGARVYYNPQTKRAHLVKGLPSLQCGIWDAIKREDMDCVQKYLRAWSRTVVSNSEGQSLLDFAAATGSHEIHRRITEAQATNELVAHSMALDTEKMLKFLTSRREKEKCDLLTCDQSFDPPRPLIAELRLTYGQRAEEVIQLLASYGMPDEHSYLCLSNFHSRDQMQRELNAFDLCPFVLSVNNAKSLEAKKKAWLMLGDDEFNVRKRRSKDGATYLHFLVERYLASADKPLFQRKIVRLMFRLALSGLDVQARDHHGRTALVLAAEHCRNPWDEKHDANQRGNVPSYSTKISPRESLLKHKGDASPIHNIPVRINQEEVPYSNGSTVSTEMTAQLEWSTKSVMGSSVEKFSAKPEDMHSTIPDQHLLEMLLQLGIDSSIGNLKHECLQKERFVPRDALTVRARNSGEAQQNTKCLPGAWPLIDLLICAVSQNKPKEHVNYLLKELESAIRDHLVRVQARRNGLTLLELAKAMLPKDVQKQMRKQSKSITKQASNAHISAVQHLVDLLQRYTGTTEFAMAAMAGDTKRMRHCLAMGNGTQKLNAHLENYFEIVSNNLRASFVKRPLILNVMEYSCPEAVGFMLKAGANVREFYPGEESFKPRRSVYLNLKSARSPQSVRLLRPSNHLNLKSARSPRTVRLLRPSNLSVDLSEEPLSLVEIIDRHVVRLCRFNQLHLIEELIIQGYEPIQNALLRFPHPRTSLQLAKLHQHVELAKLLSRAPKYQEAMNALQEAVVAGDELQFASLGWNTVRRTIGVLNRGLWLKSLNARQQCGLEMQVHYHFYGTCSYTCSNPQPGGPGDCVRQTSTHGPSWNERLCSSGALFGCWSVRRAWQLDCKCFITNRGDIVSAGLSVDWRGRSLLHLAVIHRQNKLALQLIDMCPSLTNNQDCLGRTPMHYAICLGDGRELFLKLVARMGGLNKTIKDFENVSIGNYGDQFEKGVEKYRDLVRHECELRPPNIRLTETRRLRLPDEPQEGRNLSWAVEEFSAALNYRQFHHTRVSVSQCEYSFRSLVQSIPSLCQPTHGVPYLCGNRLYRSAGQLSTVP